MNKILRQNIPEFLALYYCGQGISTSQLKELLYDYK